MSISIPPPEFQFTSLNYNPNFWIHPTGDLTQSVANTLYLRKTVTDTATALETFNSGINTTFLKGLSPSSNIEIASNLTSGELYLGVDSAGTNGRIGHIHIGDANNLPAGAGIHINNGITNASNTNISNGTSTTGNVNILSGTTSNGNVNIKTGTGAGQINLGNTSGTQTITFNRPLTLGYNPSAITTSQLGYKINGAATGITVLTPANNQSSLWSATLTDGIWLITAVLRFVTPGAAGYITGSISSTNNVGDIAAMVSASNTSTTNQVMQVTRIVNTNVSGVGPWYLVAQCSAVTNVDSLVFNVYRIA